MGISAKFKMNLKRAVFLDRDGVINDVVDRGENFSVQGRMVRWTAPFSFKEFKIKPEAEDFLISLKNLGMLNILFTNQPDIAYGSLPIEEHEIIMSAVTKMPLDDIFVCLHKRNDGCDCKKPKPGMIIQAAGKFGIDLANSYVIGDSEADMLAGRAAGCKTIIINYGYNKDTVADIRVNNLFEAVEIIKKDQVV